jgi:hypothetical protein
MELPRFYLGIFRGSTTGHVSVNRLTNIASKTATNPPIIYYVKRFLPQNQVLLYGNSYIEESITSSRCQVNSRPSSMVLSLKSTILTRTRACDRIDTCGPPIYDEYVTKVGNVGAVREPPLATPVVG